MKGEARNEKRKIKFALDGGKISLVITFLFIRGY